MTTRRATAVTAVPDPEPDPDVFSLNEDGTVDLRITGTDRVWEMILRRPKLGELGEFGDLCERAGEWLKDKDRTILQLTSAKNPCGEMYQRAFEILGGEKIPVEELPSWCIHTAAMNELIIHWYQSPLARSSVRALVAAVQEAAKAETTPSS